MLEEYSRQEKITRVIKAENRPGLRFSLVMVGVLILLTLLVALLGRTAPSRVLEKLENLAAIMNVIAIAMLIVVLAVRRTIYFSPRLFRGQEIVPLVDLLRKWRRIDLVLNCLAALVALLGLVLAFFGFPLVRIFHFFVSSWLVMMILMPIPWKVQDKIRNFEKSGGRLDV